MVLLAEIKNMKQSMQKAVVRARRMLNRFSYIIRTAVQMAFVPRSVAVSETYLDLETQHQEWLAS